METEYTKGFKDGYDAFEGGLPKAIATAELLERQRIIKLLNGLVDKIESDYCCYEDDGNRITGIAEAIALINGEK